MFCERKILFHVFFGENVSTSSTVSFSVIFAHVKEDITPIELFNTEMFVYETFPTVVFETLRNKDEKPGDSLYDNIYLRPTRVCTAALIISMRSVAFSMWSHLEMYQKLLVFNFSVFFQTTELFFGRQRRETRDPHQLRSRNRGPRCADREDPQHSRCVPGEKPCLVVYVHQPIRPKTTFATLPLAFLSTT